MAEAQRREAGFLGRWSRLKAEAREAKPEPSIETSPLPATVDDAPPELPPVETLTFDSDFTGFLHPKVDETLRRDALRKLFSDPHFNVMDGLDVYIDDYTVSEPIPAAMLASMKQAQRILRWAEGHDDEADDEKAAVASDDAAVPPGSAAVLSAEAGGTTPPAEKPDNDLQAEAPANSDGTRHLQENAQISDTAAALCASSDGTAPLQEKAQGLGKTR